MIKMPCFKTILILFSTLCFNTLFISSSFAQYFISGQDASNIKWRQINTNNFRIIYPEDFEKQSQYLANILERVYFLDTRTLKYNPKKISVILHNRSVISNAFVAWAPKRMEFYTCPPQSIYAENWLEQLAIHEFRHVVQIDKLNQGTTKILSYIFGQQAAAAVLGLYVPRWFMEGDAVSTETALSNTGRGRIPSFEMILRTQLLEKGKYSYDKAVFGSYKDFVPDCYHLGYPVVAYARKKYGSKIWDNTLTNIAKRPFSIIPFSKGIKQITHISKTKFYNETLSELDSLWKIQGKVLSYTKYKLINKIKSKFYTNYVNPYYLDSSNIIAEKTGIDDINRFVSIDKDGNESIIFTPGFYFTESLSHAKNLICWAEKQFDHRWGNRNYSIIRIYDVKTKKSRQITNKSRLFSPSLSHDASKIAAVKITAENDYSLVIIDVETGKILKIIKTADNSFFIKPSWSDDDNKIVSIVLNEKGKSIAIIYPDIPKVEYLTPFSFVEISKPVMYKNYILYSAAYSGIENIYALNIKSKKIFQVTSARFGAKDPNISYEAKKIIYSNYTASGYKIAEIEFKPENWEPLKYVTNNSIKLYEAISRQEIGKVQGMNMKQKNYESKKYYKWKNLFYFHSWAPLSIDIDNLYINPGFSVMSQNNLSTCFANLGYAYNINELTGKYYANFSYQGFYPILDARVEYGKRKSSTYKENKKIDFAWNETNIKTSIRLPINITKGKYFRLIQPQIQFTYKKLDIDKSSPVRFVNSNVRTVDYRFFAYNIIKSNAKDMYPKWGQIVDLNYKSTPFNENSLGTIFSFESVMYFPGIINHHSFKLCLGIQKRHPGSYRFPVLIFYPRGFSNQYNEKLYSFLVNYKFPLLYPDLHLSSIVYLKRIKANLFFDYAKGKENDIKHFYKSTGIELTADLHLLRFIAPFQMGIRTIYKPDFNTFNYEFLFSVNFDEIR